MLTQCDSHASQQAGLAFTALSSHVRVPVRPERLLVPEPNALNLNLNLNLNLDTRYLAAQCRKFLSQHEYIYARLLPLYNLPVFTLTFAIITLSIALQLKLKTFPRSKKTLAYRPHGRSDIVFWIWYGLVRAENGAFNAK